MYLYTPSHWCCRAAPGTRDKNGLIKAVASRLSKLFLPAIGQSQRRNSLLNSDFYCSTSKHKTYITDLYNN
jgi:hypothetical protein